MQLLSMICRTNKGGLKDSFSYMYSICITIDGETHSPLQLGFFEPVKTLGVLVDKSLHLLLGTLPISMAISRLGAVLTDRGILDRMANLDTMPR